MFACKIYIALRCRIRLRYKKTVEEYRKDGLLVNKERGDRVKGGKMSETRLDVHAIERTSD